MYNTAKDLLDALRATPDTLKYLLQGISQDQASTARGGDEGWSVVEVMCHLRDAEERNLLRIKLMHNQNNPILEGYDHDQWALERNYAAARLDEALPAFLKFRAETIKELEALSPGDWERPGTHTEMGPITVINYVNHLVSHDAVHLAQIARQLQGK
jgi:hypothetical protein